MKTKVGSALIAFVAAMFLWFYVVSSESPDTNQTYYNIPVIFENESSLMDRELMLVTNQHPTVTLRLSGNRTDLSKLTSGSIVVTVDLNAITEPGHYERDYRVSFPSGIPSVSLSQRVTPSVPVDVVEYGTKQVPVKLMMQGELQEGLILDQDRVTLGTSHIKVSGPKTDVDAVTAAGIAVDCTNLSETLVGDFVFTLLDEAQQPVDAKNLTSDTGEIHVVLPIEHVKEIPLRAELIPGGGAYEENANCTIEPATILISGSQEALDRINELTITSVDLGTVDSKTGFAEFAELKLPENVTNRSNITGAAVNVQLRGLATKTLTIGKDQIHILNVPSGMLPMIYTQQLDVVIRGPVGEVSGLTADMLTLTVDAATQNLATYSSVSPTITVEGSRAGAYGKYTITVGVVVQMVEPTTEPTTEP